MKSSMRYYLGRFLYNKPGSDDYMGLDKIEDLFSGLKPMIAYLVEDLVHKKRFNEAKGLCIRHDVGELIRPDVKEELNDVVYDPKKDFIIDDEFGPISEPRENYLALPSDI